MASIDDYPQLKALLDPNGTVSNVETREFNGEEYVRVTKHFDDQEGGQFLFKIVGGNAEQIAADNVVDFPSALLTTQAVVTFSGTMNDSDHAKVAQEAINRVDNYKTGTGPDHGNLACMWACRHVVYFAVNMWITKADGTAQFYDELRKGGMKPDKADNLPAGAIIISPTTDKGIGHVGILGAGSGDDRLVYSNHSPSHSDPVARWKQNYTVKSFTDFHKAKGLETYFYRLPMVGAAAEA
jgi:hypothetical protein